MVQGKLLVGLNWSLAGIIWAEKTLNSKNQINYYFRPFGQRCKDVASLLVFQAALSSHNFPTILGVHCNTCFAYVHSVY